MPVLDRELVDEAIYNISAYSGVDFEIHEKYSGRGMYGAECFGIVGPLPSLLQFSASLASQIAQGDTYDGADLVNKLFRNVAMDNMGLSSGSCGGCSMLQLGEESASPFRMLC